MATIMFCRILRNSRMKTHVTIIGFSIICVCSLLVYRAFTSQSANTYLYPGSAPTFNQKNVQKLRFQQENVNIPHVNNFDNTFHVNLLEKQKLRKDVFHANKDETLKDRDLLSADSREALTKFLVKLYPSNWATATETDEVAMDLKHILLDYGFDSNMSCQQIDSLRLGNSVSFSGSKFIEIAYDLMDESGGARINDNNMNRWERTQNEKSAYVVKSSSNDLQTKVACMKQVYDANLCATMGSYRLLREVLMLAVLRHPNILLMKGYCLRGNRIAFRIPEKGLIVVTEVGTPLTLSTISDMSWSQRVYTALQIGQLLQFLNSSPLGSLRFTKMSLRDFVHVQGTIVKLADLDDLEVGDKPCSEDSHCEVPYKNKDTYCKNGFCEGLNHLINFNIALKEVLQPLLQNPPGPDEQTVVTRLSNVDISVSQFVAELQVLFKKSQAEESSQNVHEGLVERNRESLEQQRQDNMRHNHVQTNLRGESGHLDKVLVNFQRYNQRNFAGIYDYLCASSRVTWGCVHTVTSLMEAANLCLQDHNCQCFVTFSTQPETDNLMTIVLKNGSDSNPHSSSGTTLFIRQQKPLDVQVGDSHRDHESEEYEETKKISKPSPQVQSCITHTLQSQEIAHYSREKRLMAHLGLKGSREQAWRRSVLRQNMDGQSQLVPAEGGGGRFLANLTKRYADEGDNRAKKVVFISEDGPHVYHMAYAVVYHLDRILGLYHTPPCVGKQLATEDVDRYLRNSQWDEMFRSLIESDGTLSGIMVVPMPRVIKNIDLTFEPRQTMVTTIAQLSRQEKLQLEYVLLWWLAKIDYKRSDHQGYKDHLIHFNSDKAFTNIYLDMSGYLYHCQFPSVVYHSLACFQCDPIIETRETMSRQICSLGEEVIKRARAMFADDAEFFVHNMRKEDLITTINSAATSILQVIDSCIKTFGRESVLY